MMYDSWDEPMAAFKMADPNIGGTLLPWLRALAAGSRPADAVYLK